MDKENEIVENMLKENAEFRKMQELHAEYEDRLEDFNKKQYLSDEEKVERKKLKKKKLATKDRMAAIMADCK